MTRDTPFPLELDDRFRDRMALADRILLAMVVCSMALALYAVAQWGMDVASTRVLFDGMMAGGLTAILAVPVLLTMVLMKRSPRLAGAGLVCAAYVVGMGLWCFSLVVAWDYAGSIAALVGVAAAGIGVVAVAVAGALAHGELLMAAGLMGAAGLVVALRRFGCAVVG
jgi:hypothetical protein